METEVKSVSRPIYKVVRGELMSDLKEPQTYDTVLYRTRMRVDYPITLVGLSFFGPHKKGTSPVTYVVEYEISHSYKPDYYYCYFFKRKNVMNPVFAKGKVTIKATPNEIFFVDIGEVNIPADTGIEMAFCLEGPATGRMKDPARTVVITTKMRDIQFQLTRGSFQMPEIHFVMEEEKFSTDTKL